MTVGDRSRSERSTSTYVAVGLAVVALLLVATSLILWVRSGFASLPQRFISPVGFLAVNLDVVTNAVAGMILVVRKPDNRIGWVVVVYALITAAAPLANGYVAYAASGHAVPVDPAIVIAPAEYGLPMATLFYSLIALLFPTGRLIDRRWRWVVAASITGTVLMIAGLAATPGPYLVIPGLSNPLATGEAPTWAVLLRNVVGPVLLLVGAIGAGAALVLRYRPADVTVRLQIRWWVAAAVALIVGFAAYLLALATLPPGSPLGELLFVYLFVAASAPPIALVIAILRYRLYEIDTIIGRTFVYGLLTAILAGLYTASVRFFNVLFVDLTGESSELALVVTTLILATTFTPIKRRLETLVERWMTRGRPRPSEGPQGDPDAPGEQPEIVAGDAAWFDDPAFVSALRTQIRAVLADERRPGPGTAARHEDPPDS